MWSYLRREKALGRTLQQEEYSQSFLTWSRGFLGYEFSAVAYEQKSIAAACAEEVEQRACSGRKRAYYARMEEEEHQQQQPTKKLKQSRDQMLLPFKKPEQPGNGKV